MHESNHTRASILIVDDDPMNLSVLLEYLHEMGFDAQVEQDGQSALEHIHTNPPELILLDIMMPEVDGFEVCRRLKADPETRDIPVIFMTALSGVRDLVTGFEMGAVDYITKPYSPEEILARVTTHLTLQRQRSKLRAVNAMKNKFFTLVTHDMTEVLSTLVSLSDFLVMLVSELDGERTQKAAKMVEDSVQSAIKLLENLSKWTQIQNGKLEFQPEIVDLYTLVMENVSLLRSYARDKQIDVSSSVQINTLVYTDYDIGSMILHNLLLNALWFTKPGGKVRISATKKDRFVEVAVSDTGIGIDQKNLVKLFRIDQKFRTHGTAGEHGTGLGLALCKELIEMNGGEIWVESQLGQGSTFSFTLPCGQRAA